MIWKDGREEVTPRPTPSLFFAPDPFPWSLRHPSKRAYYINIS